MKDLLTNESLRKLFDNNFALANFSIEMGRFFVRSGRGGNLAEILDEVRKHPTEQNLKDLKEGKG